MLALATEAIFCSVAGSITSKRAPSEDFFHLPPIQRSVGTLARRLSYAAIAFSSVIPGRPQGEPGIQKHVLSLPLDSGFRPSAGPGMTAELAIQCPLHAIDDAIDGRQDGVFESVGRRQRAVRRGDAHQRTVEIVERLVGD